MQKARLRWKPDVLFSNPYKNKVVEVICKLGRCKKNGHSQIQRENSRREKKIIIYKKTEHFFSIILSHKIYNSSKTVLTI